MRHSQLQGIWGVFADLVLIQASGETISPCGMHETPSFGLTSSLKKFMCGHQVLQQFVRNKISNTSHHSYCGGYEKQITC
jgi:hypothetical protein